MIDAVFLQCGTDRGGTLLTEVTSERGDMMSSTHAAISIIPEPQEFFTLTDDPDVFLTRH